MTQETTEQVRVEVRESYHGYSSYNGLGHHLFAYEITIVNQRASVIQLLSRHWHILESDGSKKEVVGEGVVGQQPILAPDMEYSYTSACKLQTEIGCMWGTYYFIDLERALPFQVTIPLFRMVVPYRLN
jgi:ApaG protein